MFRKALLPIHVLLAALAIAGVVRNWTLACVGITCAGIAFAWIAWIALLYLPALTLGVAARLWGRLGPRLAQTLTGALALEVIAGLGLLGYWLAQR